MKNVCLLLCCLSLLLCGTVSAQDSFFVKNNEGVELRYKILNDSEVELFNNTPYQKIRSSSYKKTGSSSYKYISNYKASHIKIPEQIYYNNKTYAVTSIGKLAFYLCESLTTIEIPSSVTSIGEDAFNSCKSLTSIEIPSSVTSIGNSAFYACKSLTSIEILSSGTSIGNTAFAYCDNLTSIIIPNTVRLIGNYHFFCRNLKEIDVIMYDETKKPKFGTYTKHNYKLPPLKRYLKYYIEPVINAWQIKEEFEKTTAWQERVNETTRQAKISELMEQYSKEYFKKAMEMESKEFAGNSLELNTYDADNETFLVKISNIGDVLLPVPIDAAQSFKENWATIKGSADPTFVPSGESVMLSAITFTDGARQYTYDSKTKAQYQVTNIDYNFDPIEIEQSGTTLASNSGIGGDAKIETKEITVGKSDVDINIPTTTIKNHNTFVVIIANENYTHEKRVEFAINDGSVFNQYCQKTLGIPAQNIHFTKNATYGNIVSEVNWLESVLKQIGGEAKAIFYYSGHGIPNESTSEAYLLPTDCANSNYQTAYSLNSLYTALGNTPCESVTYFIDACFSGAERSGKMMASTRGVAIKAKTGVLAGNSVLFSAASSDQTASAYTEKGHGIFTYFLLKKLQESQGNASYGEMADYITKQVGNISTIKNMRQTPNTLSSPSIEAQWRNWQLIK